MRGFIFSRHFTSLTKLPKLPQLSNIPSKHRLRVVLQAQQALTEYLHATRSLSFTYAEHITQNSLFSLSNLISQLHYSHPTFSSDFSKFLSYHPINEFEFLFESFGIPFDQIHTSLPPKHFFLSENDSIFNIATTLSAFGFPWNQLGKLYKQEISIFRKDSKALNHQLCGFLDIGFDTCSVIGICLAFPFVLSESHELTTEIHALVDVLKRVFLDFNLKSSVEGNLDASYGFCRKIKIFIGFGCERKEVGELMGKRWDVFHECSEEGLMGKVDFFRRMNAADKDIGMLLLRCPVILHYDLEYPVFSAMSYLKQLGLSDEELNAIALEYPFVLGKNRLANLPHLMRALDLHEWFFRKITNGSHELLANFDIGSPDEKVEKEYQNYLEKIRSMKNYKHAQGKLNFLLGIGFGENLVTLKVFSNLHGTRKELQERFDYLLQTGVEFSKLCKIVKMLPKVLNQCPDVLDEKLYFLCNEVGSSLQYLDVFPGYLCFDLENRIKPRYRIYKWLTENKMAKQYSLASIVATSENRFMARLVDIHPTVLKQWLERFSSKNHSYSHEDI